MTLWEQISINFAVLINLLVAFFYPFSDGPGGKKLLEIISVDCQNCFPSLKCFLLCCAPSSRLSSSGARASLISLPIFLVLVPRAHRLSRFPYFFFRSSRASVISRPISLRLLNAGFSFCICKRPLKEKLKSGTLLWFWARFPRKMVKFNPGLSEIFNHGFLAKRM